MIIPDFPNAVNVVPPTRISLNVFNIICLRGASTLTGEDATAKSIIPDLTASIA